MMFRKQFRDAIRFGRKTQTRRLKLPRFKIGSIQPVMHDYRNLCRMWIQIDAIRQQRLHSMTMAETMAEGCPRRDGWGYWWVNIWKDINGPYDQNTVVWVIEFHVCKKPKGKG